MSYAGITGDNNDPYRAAPDYLDLDQPRGDYETMGGYPNPPTTPTTPPPYAAPQVPAGHVGTPSDIATQEGKAKFAATLKPWYQQYLGREAGDADIGGFWTDYLRKYGGDTENIRRFLETSPEAQAYKAKQAAAPAAAGANTSGAWTAGSGSFKDWFMKQLEGKPFNQQTLLDLESLLQASGSKLTPANASGERTKIWDPTIQDWVRVGFGEGTPQWIAQGWGENGPPAGGGGGGATFDPNSPLLQPWTKPFTPPRAGQPGDIPNAPEFNFREFDKPADFHAPTMEEMMVDPGYNFRKKEAEDAFLNSAAARGVLRSGGTLKDFLKYGQDMASQEYQNVYDRARGVYDTNFNAGVTDYTLDRGTAEMEYAPQLTNWQVQGSDLRRLQENEYDRAWREYLAEQDTFYRNQGNVYDRLYGGAQLGTSAY